MVLLGCLPYLIGETFIHFRYGRCRIDNVEPYRLKNGTFTVVLKHNIYSLTNSSIPEIYEFQCPRKPLLKYLMDNDIEFDLKRFGLGRIE